MFSGAALKKVVMKVLEELDAPIEYDKYGRMNYNPMFHANMNTPWARIDEQYLIAWYDIIGPEEMSFALDRTIRSVMQRVVTLRETGVMKKPLKSSSHKRVNRKVVMK